MRPLLRVGVGVLAGVMAMGGAGGSRAEGTATEAGLPLTTVKLYTSGVGYFERSGFVEGAQSVTIPATVGHLNDVLKSLVVQDPQGDRAALVEYASRDPLSKTLGSFGLDVAENASLSQLLVRLRGERVKVAAPQDTEGTIVGVETRQEAGGKDVLVPVEYLTLLTDQGFRSFALAQIHHLTLMNARLAQEVEQALALLATRHDTQKTPVTVRFEGNGRRPVRLAYLLETPVWKTTYRLVLGADAKPSLQGWALVENPTDQDWSNVRLSLVSGRPVSFTMNLADPSYVERPVVQPEFYGTVRSQVHESALTGPAEEEAPRRAPAKMGKGRTRNELVEAKEAPAVAAPASPMAMADAGGAWDLGLAPPAMAHGEDLGHLFQYDIAQPVTLARHHAAMVPIVNTLAEGDDVRVFNVQVHAKHPMRGFRLRNTSDLHLMQGPITVFQDGAYAGDARLLDLAPKQDRLITFALDLNTEVERRVGSGRQEVQSVVLKRGTLLATRKWVEQTLYTVKNGDRRPATVLVEHPVRPDWSLVDLHPLPERTRESYRIPVLVKPGETVTLTVQEQRPLQERVVLGDIGPDQLGVYLQAPEVGGKVKDALQQVAALRQKVGESQVPRAAVEQQLKDIEQEQHRIRDNMQRLDQRSDLYGRYVKKLDAQETEVERLRKALADARRNEDEQRRQLQRFLEGLDLS